MPAKREVPWRKTDGLCRGPTVATKSQRADSSSLIDESEGTEDEYPQLSPCGFEDQKLPTCSVLQKGACRGFTLAVLGTKREDDELIRSGTRSYFD